MAVRVEGPPPHRLATFKHLEDKLRDFQRKNYSMAQQLSTIDWWIGKLLLLRSDIELGRRL